MTLPESPPPRLVETDGPVGDCLRRALAASPTSPELPPFSALQERRQRRLQRQLAMGALLSALALAIGLRSAQREGDAPSARAELTAVPLRESLAPSPSAEPVALSDAKPALPEKSRSSKAEPEVARARPRPSSARVEPKRAVEDAPRRPDSAHRGARACAELARAGSAELALSCYRDLASGTGITAELALFEQARLEGKALRRPEQALQTLDSYRRRFPSGSLRAEVMLAQIDWLVRAGDRERALELVDEALASSLLTERRAELTRLRADLAP